MPFDPSALNTDRQLLMGILNVTPDSFSDGGRFSDPRVAVEHALRMAAEGAAIIDVGGESSRPGAEPTAACEECRRVLPVIEGVRRRSPVPISIDTTKAAVAARALDAGADIINDISAGRFDPSILALAAERGVPICLMHMRGTPRDMQRDTRYDDLIGEVRGFLGERIEAAIAAGMEREAILIDPGIGFGKSAEDNVQLMRRLGELRELGAPILVGPSRKSFLGRLLGHEVENRLEGTLAALAVAQEGGAAVLRVHDVAPARRFLEAHRLFHPPR